VNWDSEFAAFKRKVDLRQFAVSLGYETDRRESWRGIGNIGNIRLVITSTCGRQT
jgi:hypothetical protein